MSISKRAFGVEGYKTEKNKFYTSSTPTKPIKLTSAKIKSFAPKKVDEFSLIDSYKKSNSIYFIYENDEDKRIHIKLLITEIEQARCPSDFINIKITAIIRGK